MAKDMNLLVRCCGKTGSVCVYKKSYPNATYRLLKNTGENEKYTLIIPPKRSRNLTMANNVGSYGNKESLQESKIKNLFDYERQYVNPFHEVKVESNQSELYTPHQTVTSKQNESGLYNYMPLENKRDQYWQRSDRQNELWHSRTNKRSYDDGPGSGEEREEQASSSSHHSYNNQRRFESRQSFKEEKSRELNYKTREGQDNSFYSRRTIKHVEEGSREFNYQSREGQDSSFFSRRTIKTVRKGSQEFNYKSREDQDSSFYSRRPNKPVREGSQEFNYKSREDQYSCFFSRRPITPVQEGSREFNYQPREGQNNNSVSKRTIEPAGEGSQKLNDQSREIQDKSSFQHKLESKYTFEGTGSQELNSPPISHDNGSIFVDYNNMNRNQKHSNYGQYYQKEKRGNNDRHYNSRGLWSNEIKKNYDQRF